MDDPRETSRIIFVSADGVSREVAAPVGDSVMEAAVWNEVPGILADCGGDGGCATCHVYVEPGWLARTGAASNAERNTLRFVVERAENSRLSCYIKVTAELDGLVVRVPRRQF